VHACISEAAFASRKREAGRGVFYLLFLLAYAFTVPITFLTASSSLPYQAAQQLPGSGTPLYNASCSKSDEVTDEHEPARQCCSGSSC
jgi:hypothetical protein